MIEPQLSIENIPFVWGVAFVVDILIGVLTFMLVLRKNVVTWLKGTLTWCGWWSFASALSLIISMVSGPLAPFSYHQIGVFTETMVNIGLVLWAIVYAFNNWFVYEEDWPTIEKMREHIAHKNKIKLLGSDDDTEQRLL